MKVEAYDSIMLKDGRDAIVIEKFTEDFFMVDAGGTFEDGGIFEVGIDEIDYVIERAEST